MHYQILGAIIAFAFVILLHEINPSGIRKFRDHSRHALARWYRRHLLPPGYRIQVVSHPSFACQNDEFILMWYPKQGTVLSRRIDVVYWKRDLWLLRDTAWSHYRMLGLDHRTLPH